MKANKFGRLKIEGAERDNLAARLSLMIEDALAGQRDLSERWKRNYSFYRGVPAMSTEMLPAGFIPMHFHLTKPRIDALCDAVSGNIGSQTPMILAKFDKNSEGATKLENQMQRAMDKANIDALVKKTLPMAAITGVAPVKVSFKAVASGYLPDQVSGVQSDVGEFDYCGLCFEVIDPGDFIIYQPELYDVDSAPLVGHVCPCTRAEIEVKIRMGDYDDIGDVDELTATSDTGNSHARSGSATKAQSTRAVAPEDQTVRRCEVIFRADLDAADLDDEMGDIRDGKDERYYIATVLPDERKLLSLRYYDLKKPWYVDLRVQCPEPGNWWPDGSPAHDLQGLQDMYNHHNNAMTAGVYFYAMPPVADPESTENKITVLRPGGSVGGNSKLLQTGFNPAPFALINQDIERRADAVIGISQAAQAQEQNKAITATEANQIFAGQSKREAAYTGVYSEGLERLAETCAELLYLNGELYARVEDVDPNLFLLPVVWEVNGRSPSLTPEATVKKLQFLISLCQNDGPQPDQIIQAVTQKVAEMIAGMMEGHVDPQTGQPADPKMVQGQAMQMAQKVIAEAMQGVQPAILNKAEIYRSAVDALNLSNADRIKNMGEEGPGDQPDAQAAQMPQQPPLGLAS